MHRNYLNTYEHALEMCRTAKLCRIIKTALKLKTVQQDDSKNSKCNFYNSNE